MNIAINKNSSYEHANIKSKVAIMQPYFFPYVGYFQLINAVDKFIIFDDVNYIKRGWVNKNRILQNGEVHNFTLPVKKASQNKTIADLAITSDEKVIEKLVKQIHFSYSKSKNFTAVFPLIEQLLTTPERNLSIYLSNILIKISDYLGIKTEFIYSSSLSNHINYNNAENRIIELTKLVGGNEYYNLPGGVHLYNSKNFNANDITLHFLSTEFQPYQQLKTPEFIPGLSIIDYLMCK